MCADRRLLSQRGLKTFVMGDKQSHRKRTKQEKEKEIHVLKINSDILDVCEQHDLP